MTEVFCDYLDVTCSPESSFLDALTERLKVLVHLAIKFLSPERDSWVHVPSGGTVVLERKARFHRASFSGGMMAYLRESGELESVLMLLGSVGHKVTRLDATMDVEIDTPSVLRELEAAYPDDYVRLTRKAMRVTRFYSARPRDGQLSGTWYVGHKTNARVSARVYDKVEELVEGRGHPRPMVEGKFPRGLTRYELTFRKDHGCSLRDVVMPESLFYQYASPTLLIDKPASVGPWESTEGFSWSGEPVPPKLDHTRFVELLERSPELVRIAELAGALGPGGKVLVMRRFEALLDRVIELGAVQGVTDFCGERSGPTQICDTLDSQQAKRGSDLTCTSSE